MTFVKCIALIISLLTLSGIQAQTRQDQLAEIMQTYHRFNMFDGAVLVAENGTVIYEAAFGMANREWNIPNTVNTKFMIGSISKPITATLVLVLVQKGLIDLQQTLEHYLPEFKQKPAGQVTIHQLLSHTSGIANYDIIKDFFPRISRQSFTRENYIKIYCDAPLAFTPGTRYAYSSWGYFTLGCIIERVTGKTYSQVMKEAIFDPAGMEHSGSYLHTQIIEERASGYDYGLGDYSSADFRDQSNTMGTGDLYSTVGDLFRFHLGLSKNRLLNKTLTQQMFTPGMRPAQYGYGWFNQNFKYTATDSVTANYHLGSTEGFISFFLRIPETNSMVVILCNSAPTDFFGITKNLVKVLYNKPVIIKEPVHKKMETIIATSGAAKSITAYQEMKLDSARYHVDWLQLYYLAEKLVTLKRYEDARITAENNLKEFENRDLMALSLANIYLALNRKEDAIRHYRLTLKLNAGNEEAKNRLKELQAN